jgi:septum formation protein
MNHKPQCYLASTSPRRQELLQQLCLSFDILTIDTDESMHMNELAEDFVQRLALEKARAGWKHSARKYDVPVIGSDTAVVYEGEVFGKPRDAEQALQMLIRLSGSCHQVMTAVAIKDAFQEKIAINISRVCFRSMTTQEINAYCATSEPEGKAGAYAIQGLAAQFIHHLEGSFSAVMGLPLYETAELLRQFAVKIPGSSNTYNKLKNKPEN